MNNDKSFDGFNKDLEEEINSMDNSYKSFRRRALLESLIGEGSKMSDKEPYTLDDKQELFVRTKRFHKERFSQAVEDEIDAYVDRLRQLIEYCELLELDINSFEFFDEIADEVEHACMEQVRKIRERAVAIAQFREGKSDE